MKHLFIFLTLTSLLLAACGSTPTPDLEATVQAAIAATQAAPDLEATVQAAVAATQIVIDLEATGQTAPPTGTLASEPVETTEPTVVPVDTLPATTSDVPAGVTGDTPAPSQAGKNIEPLCPDSQSILVTDLDIRQTPDQPEPPPRVPFRDPVFGTCLVRVTNRQTDLAADDPSDGLKNEYSRVQSFNADGSLILVRSIEANWYLYDAHTLQPLGQLPLAVEPRWDASNPDLLYYSDETRLMAYNVRSEEQSLVHDFATDFSGQPLAAV